MKWKEPWIESIKRQSNLNFFSKKILMNCVSWSLGIFLVILLFSVFVERQISLKLYLFAPIIGFSLAWFIYLITWLSPLEISSGPNGIVLAKGGGLTLFPWSQIIGYEINQKKLVLKFIDESSTDFILPENIDINAIKDELTKEIVE